MSSRIHARKRNVLASCIKPVVLELMEPRVLMSAALEYRPQNPDGTLGPAVKFQTVDSVEEFTPQQRSLLQNGFAAPQYDLFLRLQGIAGESNDSKHPGEIELSSFSWGGDSLAGGGGGGGGGAGKSTLQELHFTANLSKASPRILQALTDGSHIQTARLTVRSAGDKAADFLTIDLDDALVSSYLLASGSALPQEEFTLDFSDVDVKFRPQNPDGSLGAPVVFAGTGPAEEFAPQQQSILAGGFTASSAADYFLSVNGIPGESSDGKHPNQIDVLSFSWGGDSNANSGTGGGGGAGRSELHELHVVSAVNKASPKLVEAMARGTHILNTVLTGRKAGKDQLEFLKVNLDNVLVSSYQVTTDPVYGLVEEYTLNFGATRLEYRPQAADGTPQPPVIFAEIAPAVQDFKPDQRALLGAHGPTPPPLDLFLNVAGAPGESRDAKHPGAIDLTSFSWGGDAVVVPPTGGGGGAGKVTFQEFHFTANVSKASPKLLDQMTTGAAVPTTVLTVRKSGGTQQEFYTLTLGGGQVSSYQATPNASALEEEATLRYTQANLTYKPQNPDGTPGSPVVFSGSLLDTEDFSPAQRSLLQGGYAEPAGVDFFLTVDGIPGDSAGSKNPNAIGVTSFSWGGVLPGSSGGAGGGGGASRPVFHELHVVAPVSKASPKLFQAMADGATLRFADLLARKSGGTQLDFYQVNLDDVHVSSYQVRTGPDGLPVEEFTLNFAAADNVYRIQNPDGSPGGTVVFHEDDQLVEDFKPAQTSQLDAALPVSAVGTYFLKVDGIPGESPDAKHPGEIPVLSFGWGGDATGGSSSGGGGGAGRAEFHELHVVSRVSKASPLLMKALSDGTPVPNALLTGRKAGGTQLDFLKVNLKDVLVSSYQVTTAKDGSFLEEVTYSFAEAREDYFFQRPDGSIGGVVTFTENDGAVENFKPRQRSLLQDGYLPAVQDMFLKVEGIAGDSADAKQQGAIRILAFNWGGDGGVPATSGGAAGTPPEFQELHFVAETSKASPLLLDRMFTGAHVKSAAFTARSRGAKQAEFLKINLDDVTVSSHQVTTAQDGRLLEEVTLRFGSQDQGPQADAGGPYSVDDGGAVTLDASGTTHPTESPAALDYEWDLDGDGVFGETGAGADRGDEVGVNPVFSAAGLFGPQTLTVQLRVTDASGSVDTDDATIDVIDVTPPETIITSGPAALTNQTTATFNFTGTDQGTPADQLTFTASLDGATPGAVTSPLVLSNLPEGTHVLSVAAKDLAGNEDPTPETYTWTVDTTGPTVTLLSATPSPAGEGTPVTLNATVDDLGVVNSNITGAEYTLDGLTWVPMTAADGAFDSPTEQVTAGLGALPAGLYSIRVRATDAAGNTGAARETELPVINPGAGFATGGGFFESPTGALAADPSLAGRATLETDVSYPPGTPSVPTGSTRFQFGTLDFRSTGYDWLIVTGDKARYQGTGTVNGVAGFKFRVTFIDGELGRGSGGDQVRVRIWHTATGRSVYDSGLGSDVLTPLGGGNLKIHT